MTINKSLDVIYDHDIDDAHNVHAMLYILYILNILKT